MVVAGDSSDRAFELVRKMEGSKHFRDTRIEGTTEMVQTGAQGVQVNILAVYVPTIEQEKVR
jgi:hypothetical protein